MFQGLCGFGHWGRLGAFGAWGWAGMVLQMIFWLVLIVGIIWLVVWAIRRGSWTSSSMSSHAVSGQPAAKDILQARYARGEITREQYQQMLEDLS